MKFLALNIDLNGLSLGHIQEPQQTLSKLQIFHVVMLLCNATILN